MKLFKNPNFLFPCCMALCMSFVMSFIMLIVNIGFHQEFFVLWLRSFTIASLVAIPTALFIAPKIRKLVNFICR